MAGDALERALEHAVRVERAMLGKGTILPATWQLDSPLCTHFSMAKIRSKNEPDSAVVIFD